MQQGVGHLATGSKIRLPGSVTSEQEACADGSEQHPQKNLSVRANRDYEFLEAENGDRPQNPQIRKIKGSLVRHLRLLYNGAEELEPVPVGVSSVDDVLLGFPDPSDDWELSPSKLSLPTLNVGDPESQVVEFRSLPERFVESVRPGVVVEFDPLRRARESQVDPLTPVLHPATLVHAEAQLPVEAQGAGQVPDPQPGVDEFDFYRGHAGQQAELQK
jgi:hypothetical protein